MTRRAVTRLWVAARLVALIAAASITAIEGSTDAAAVLALAQAAGFVIARLITSTHRAALALEVLLTTSALLLAETNVAPVFLALPLIALWELQERSPRLTLLAGIGNIAIVLGIATLVWDDLPIQVAVASALVALVIMAVAVRSPVLRGSAYDLVTQVRDLRDVHRDPDVVAAAFLEELSMRSGIRGLALETVNGDRLATRGTDWDEAGALRFPLSLGGEAIAVLITDTPLPEKSAIAELIAEQVLLLGTALAFADISAMASDAERSRLSREMHDGIAQEIASIGYALDDLLLDAPEALRPKLRHLRQELTRVVSDLRLSIFELRGRDRGTGLGIALSDLIEQVKPTVGFSISLRLDEGHARFPRAVEEQLLKITQEALTNAKRHSKATQVWVTARLHPPVAELTIEDNGVGLGVARIDSFGLEVMRERATQIKAALTVRDRHGGGTVVYLLLSPTAIGS